MKKDKKYAIMYKRNPVKFSGAHVLWTIFIHTRRERSASL